MTRKNTDGTLNGVSLVEFSGEKSGEAVTGVEQIPRADVLKYIHEMCATLSYMSLAHDGGRLSGLLTAAATEAEEQARQATATPFERLKAQARWARKDTR